MPAWHCSAIATSSHRTTSSPYHLRHAIFILSRRLSHGAFCRFPRLDSRLCSRPPHGTAHARLWQLCHLRHPQTILTLFLVYLWADSAKAMSVALSTASLRFSLAMLAISWASSFLVQIPLQLRIGTERDKNLVRRLVMTDWVRVLTMAAHCGAVIWAVAA